MKPKNRFREHAKAFSIVITFLLLSASGYSTVEALEINTFLFLEQFPENAVPLGYQRERVIQIGAFIKAGDTRIKEVTAVNLDSGIALDAKLMGGGLGTVLPNMFLVDPNPVFDSNKHKGTWEFRVTDDQGKVYTARTYKIDKTDVIPPVENVKVSGDPLAPEVSWNMLKNIPEWCSVSYAVRLLKDYYNQMYRSANLKDPSHAIPVGKLKREDLDKTYLRIECSCNDPEYPEKFMTRLRSSTFISLKEVLPK